MRLGWPFRARLEPKPCRSLAQMMFGPNKTIAVQDPSYPVYVDTTVMMGNSGTHNGTGFDGIEYMVCTPDNQFFPDLTKVSPSGDGGRGAACTTEAWPAAHPQGPPCPLHPLLPVIRRRPAPTSSSSAPQTTPRAPQRRAPSWSSW